jgi:hypothetical protein
VGNKLPVTMFFQNKFCRPLLGTAKWSGYICIMDKVNPEKRRWTMAKVKGILHPK